MTTIDGITLSSESGLERRRGTGERPGRPLLFAVMLLLAGALVVAVLAAGPALPLAASAGLSAAALMIVALGWAVAGPRW